MVDIIVPSSFLKERLEELTQDVKESKKPYNFAMELYCTAQGELINEILGKFSNLASKKVYEETSKTLRAYAMLYIHEIESHYKETGEPITDPPVSELETNDD